MDRQAYDGFHGTLWKEEINVRDFIQQNYTPYEGGAEFLSGATKRTSQLMQKVSRLFAREQANGGVLDIDTSTVTSLLIYRPGYIDKENERIVGLQTDEPLKRGVNPFGGIRMAKQACEAYGYEIAPNILEHFKFKTTHNDGVFRVYTDEMKLARHAGIITGLPDAYGRGRIIGDYRRVALYGIDRLVEEKTADKKRLGQNLMDVDNTCQCEELYQQINFLRAAERNGGPVRL